MGKIKRASNRKVRKEDAKLRRGKPSANSAPPLGSLRLRKFRTGPGQENNSVQILRRDFVSYFLIEYTYFILERQVFSLRKWPFGLEPFKAKPSVSNFSSLRDVGDIPVLKHLGFQIAIFSKIWYDLTMETQRTRRRRAGIGKGKGRENQKSSVFLCLYLYLLYSLCSLRALR